MRSPSLFEETPYSQWGPMKERPLCPGCPELKVGDMGNTLIVNSDVCTLPCTRGMPEALFLVSYTVQWNT